jgi:SAM-dependent methyltransferase
MKNPTELFSDKVKNYLAYRPGYPTALLEVLRAECNLSNDTIIVDIGSGTGLLSELFLKNGNHVYGVEPNAEMRTAAESVLKAYPRFFSVAARAEATTLKEHSLDFITAGQAYHWFELEKAKREFTRILKPEGWLVVVYNLASTDTPFQVDFKKFCNIYLGENDSEQDEADIYSAVFGQDNYLEKRVDGVSQRFDFKGLTGRVLSRVNVPEIGSPQYSEMMDSLRSLFDHQQQDGQVIISYETEIIYGQLPKSYK